MALPTRPHYARYKGMYYDVHDLIALAATKRPIRVPVSEYDYVLGGGGYAKRVQGGTQHRGRTAAAELAHPIILGPDRSLFDGVHRLARAKELGRKTIKAVRLDRMPKGYTRTEMLRRQKGAA